MEQEGITWYDVLGVLPGVETRRIKSQYEARSALLGPEMIAGAPSDVLMAITRAQGLLDRAWQVLSDPVSRRRYDEEAGIRRSGGGWASPGPARVIPPWARMTWASPRAYPWSANCWRWPAAC